MREIAIEGIDGAGKSTVADLLADRLKHHGLSVSTHRPFHEARELLGQDLYELWNTHRGSSVAINALSDVIEAAREKAMDNNDDIILFDRHWMTAFTEIANQPSLTKLWRGQDFIPAALLRVDIDTAMRRCENDLDEAWMDPSELKRYHASFNDLAGTYGNHILGIYRSDDDVSPDCLARNIEWDMQIAR